MSWVRRGDSKSTSSRTARPSILSEESRSVSGRRRVEIDHLDVVAHR